MSFNGISPSQIDFLVGHKDAPAISLYIPTSPTGIEVVQGHIKLKNMLPGVEAELTALGMRSTVAKDFLSKVAALVDDAEFWDVRSHGVAIFVGEGLFQAFHLSFPVPEAWQVGNRFNILPLIPSFLRGESHYALALDRNDVRLLLCGCDSTTEAHVPKMPRTLAAFLAGEYAEKQIQTHSAGPVGRAGSTIVHGAGDKSLDMKAKIHRFCQAVEEHLRRYLHADHCPLVLAGTSEIVNEFAAVCKYEHLLPTHVVRGLKTLKPEDIRALTQPIADAYFDRERQQALEQYRATASTGLTAQLPEELPSLAREGKVESLLATHAVIGEAPSEASALVNEAALETLANHGNVYGVSSEELDVETPAVAVLRY